MIVFSCGHATLQEALSIGPSVCRYVNASAKMSGKNAIGVCLCGGGGY